jgi:hypothetical protein
MYFSAIQTAIISTLALGLGVNAAVLGQRDAHIVDFRTYGSVECAQTFNQGVWTFTQSDLTGCKNFSAYGDDYVGSLTMMDITSGCSRKSPISFPTPPPQFIVLSALLTRAYHIVQVWEDENCSGAWSSVVTAGPQCLSHQEGIKSFLVSCPSTA